jgi:hypothetical protein
MPVNREAKMMPVQSNLSRQIISKAKFLGAKVSGIEDMTILKHSPSHPVYPKMDPNLSVGSSDFAERVGFGTTARPSKGKSVIVICH